MNSKNKPYVAILLATSLLLSFPTYTRSQQAVELLLGTPTNSVAWFPLYVAMKKGLFREHGLIIKPVILPNQGSMAALVQKAIPYITNLGRVLSGAGRGLPIKQIMVLAGKTHHVLVTSPDIASPRDLRGRTVAVSQPGTTVHRELLAILKKYDVDPKQVPVIGLGSDSNRVVALKQRRVDAIMTAVPYDFLTEKDGFRRLVYVKDVLDLPLSGLATHDDRIRDKPEETRKVLTGVLNGIAYARTRRDEVIPLLREFIGLESMEMAQRAYEVVKDIWPVDGMPSEERLKNAIAIEDVPANVPVTKMVNWTPLKQATESLKTR